MKTLKNPAQYEPGLAQSTTCALELHIFTSGMAHAHAARHAANKQASHRARGQPLQLLLQLHQPLLRRALARLLRTHSHVSPVSDLMCFEAELRDCAHQHPGQRMMHRPTHEAITGAAAVARLSSTQAVQLRAQALGSALRLLARRALLCQRRARPAQVWRRKLVSRMYLMLA